MLCDLHCHLDLFPRPEEMVARIESAGILTVAVSNTPQMYKDSLHHLAGCHFIKPALGLHPLADLHRKQEIMAFKRLIAHASYVGEIGMDGSKGAEDRTRQENIFRQVIQETQKHNCILSIHSRRMEKEVMNMLNESRARPGILHWYTGASHLIDEFVTGGHYFSVNLAMLTHPASRAKIQRMPMHRVLTESDGPFAQANGRQISPLDMSQTVSALSELWGTSYSIAERTVEGSLKTLADQNGVTL